ncbi:MULTISPECIES: DUF4160 domain-containing protein [unclassified Coleofasciculus]|uniref:DUF4160 domain-containing protein n=1 Tax=unclassified Coleofasciculus TaxID=2692782 RepID=UPI00187E94E8|nr:MULTISPECIES: DUF4160 domain-containing protein [unclassified Coleofasciculus]MBE9129957.1 DUF4160 domain-containing protein [Coleofasciculus sp. LEGE 07081]MBE9150410.1 DUF4160 domain-containing protein [Coleofasciculus sp. LEGE 07092]
MPTVLRKDGFAVRIYFNDHLPPHVHVFKGGGQVRISLGSEAEEPELVQIEGMSDKDAAKALAIVIEHQLELLKKWEEIHG